jgi:hypothetical protein
MELFTRYLRVIEDLILHGITGEKVSSGEQEDLYASTGFVEIANIRKPGIRIIGLIEME